MAWTGMAAHELFDPRAG